MFYFDDFGISYVYVLLIMNVVSGLMYGYDVIDLIWINFEFGGE